MSTIRSYPDPLSGLYPTIDNEWIDEDVYTEVLQKMVIPCTDIVITLKKDKDALYLCKRKINNTMKGLWILGGRIWFNDKSLEESAARSLHGETNLMVDTTRFKYVATNLYSWERVKQGDFPGKTLAVTFRLTVTKDELKSMSINLNPDEYDTSFGIQRFTYERLDEEQVHPALFLLFKQIFKK